MSARRILRARQIVRARLVDEWLSAPDAAAELVAFKRLAKFNQRWPATPKEAP